MCYYASVLGPKEKTRGWGEAYQAEKSKGRIHKNVGSMLLSATENFFFLSLYRKLETISHYFLILS